jgi:hypothetical protein
MATLSNASIVRSSENETFSICLAEILKADLNDIPVASSGLGLDGM